MEYSFSKDVEACMKKAGRKFTDFERAALIYNSHLPYMDILRELERIQDTTRDEVLKKQIWERLSYERKGMEQFLENTAGYVYAVRIHVMNYNYEDDDYISGYFADPEVAFWHGRKRKMSFDIEKYQIVAWNQAEAKMTKRYSESYLNKEKTEELVRKVENMGKPEAVMHYDEKGVLCYFKIDKLSCSMENNLEPMFEPDRFEDAYIDIPNPFEDGDIVKMINVQGYGVIMETQETWKKKNEKIKSSKMKSSIENHIAMNIDVFMYYADGEDRFEYICPIWLEHYELTPDERAGRYIKRH